MESSQDYSFNKAHSVCYALIAYRTAWLKANYPCEYMAALISSVMNTKDRVPIYVNACDEMGIKVLPPDVNESATDFAVVEGKIRFGLNAVKNVGDPRNLDATVNEQSVGALFQIPAVSNLRVRKVTREGRPYITVAADFSDINALPGTKAFPDLQVALRREGEKLLLAGVWRRPPVEGSAQGDDAGLMAVRFHLPSEIFEHKNAFEGVERGNILSWRQDLHRGLTGSPIDFGATMGSTSVLSATLGLFGLAILAGLSVMGAALYFFVRRGRAEQARSAATL
jgi:hypothetical protein